MYYHKASITSITWSRTQFRYNNYRRSLGLSIGTVPRIEETTPRNAAIRGAFKYPKARMWGVEGGIEST